MVQRAEPPLTYIDVAESAQATHGPDSRFSVHVNHTGLPLPATNGPKPSACRRPLELPVERTSRA